MRRRGRTQNYSWVAEILSRASLLPGWRAHVVGLWEQFEAAGLATPHFARELTKGTAESLFHRVWEMMVGLHLLGCGWKVSAPRSDNHPDFRCQRGESVLWVEATCTTAGEDCNLAEEAAWRSAGGPIPFLSLQLRWTASIRAKVEAGRRYRSARVISPGEAYVIAVNGALLSAGDFGFGISRLPFVVESTMAVGPMQLAFDPETRAFQGLAHMPRVAIRTLVSDSPVPTGVFLDGSDTSTSAVAGFGLHRVEGSDLELLVAHNPHASAPLPDGVLGTLAREWRASLAGHDHGEVLWDILQTAPVLDEA